MLDLTFAAPAEAADTTARSPVIQGTVQAGDRVAWADRTPSGALRVLTMRPGSRPAVARLAIAAGRVLYVRYGSQLVLQRPGGREAVLKSFTPTRRRGGGFDLGPRTAVWARQRVRFRPNPDGMPRAPEDVGRPQVVLRRL